VSAFGRVLGAYDVRGLVDGELTADLCYALGIGAGEHFSSQGAQALVIGRDMRESGPALSRAFALGVQEAGLRVLDVGRCATDQLYFASGVHHLPGAMFTASHNPASYNGIKLCGPGAAGISRDTGLSAIAQAAEAHLGEPLPREEPAAEPLQIAGRYAETVRRLGAPGGLGRRLKVVIDAGNGMGGMLSGQVLGGDAGLEPLDLDLIGLYLEPDGTFPNHEANPLDPVNLEDLRAAVIEHGADIGLAFDGDADRCVVVDERGEPVTPSAIVGLVASREIARVRAAGEDSPAVIHNAITSLAVPEAIREAGGRPVVSRVGHSLIKAAMREHGAVFGGEHSAHYYFRDFFCADSGMLAAMHVLAALSGQDGPLSELVAPFDRYAASGELNSVVADQAVVIAKLRAMAEVGEFGPARIEELDGVSVIGADGRWWFNVRASNTEPLLRLNVETPSRERTTALGERLLGLVRES
jgi:phosphomannomutase